MPEPTREAQQGRLEFARRVHEGDFSEDLKVRYRVSGGLPSQRLRLDLVLDGVNGARIEALDELVSTREISARLGADEIDVRELFQLLRDGLPSLAAEETEFLPDSLRGKITISVGGNEETFQFIPEEEERRVSGKSLSPPMEEVLRQLWRVTTDPITRQEGSKRA